MKIELRDMVVLCYQMFLGRNPENEAVIQDKINTYKDLFSLRVTFFTSIEFRTQFDRIIKNPLGKNTSLDLKIDENIIRLFYVVLLGREPENGEAVETKIECSFNELRNSFLSSKEFFTQYNYFSNPITLIAEDDDIGQRAGKEILKMGGRPFP